MELVVALSRLRRPPELDRQQLRGAGLPGSRPVEVMQRPQLRLQGVDLCAQLRQLPLELDRRLFAPDLEQPREPLSALGALTQPRPASRDPLVLASRPTHRGTPLRLLRLPNSARRFILALRTKYAQSGRVPVRHPSTWAPGARRAPTLSPLRAGSTDRAR